MKIISCASYYGTGSSAITDYVSEFGSVYSLTNEEFRFLHDPDGVDDLYFHLVENQNRHNSGHALKRYKKLVDFYNGNIFGRKYAPFFHDRWQEISYKYIDRLTDFTYHGWWMYDLYDRGSWFYFRKRIVNKALHKTIWKDKPDRVFNTMKDEITYCSAPTDQEFVDATKDYVRELLTEASGGTDKAVMVDQIVPPTNLLRYTRYFDNIKVVVVDRDPRDLYLLEKMEWKGGIIPHDSAELFVKWYRYTRNHRKHETFDPATTLFVRFEDLVYRYDEETARVRDFLGLDEADHNAPRSHFIPEQSMCNTRKWLEYPEEADAVAYIERELPEYLYDYSGLGVDA